MVRPTELIADNMELRRAVMPPDQAARIGREALTLFDSPDDPLSFYVRSSVEEAGLTTLRFTYGYNQIQQFQIDEQLDICRSLAAHPETANIGRLLLQAHLQKRSRGFPLTGLNVHMNSPGTEFSAHADLTSGVAYSLALSEAVVRVHDADDNILEERELDPGDEVAIVSPKNPKKRPRHSFAALIDTPRVSFVRKYKRRSEMEPLLE